MQINSLIWALFSAVFVGSILVLLKSRKKNKILGIKLNEANEELKKKIHTLEETSKQLKSVIKHMNEAIVTVKVDQRILFYNQPFLQKFAPDYEIKDGDKFGDVIRNPQLNEMLNNILESKKSEKRVMEIVVAGNRRVVEAQSVYAPERSGLVVIVIYDLTDIRQSEKMKREFITNASHQLKTPLTAIQGYAETLLEDTEMDLKIRQDFLTKIKNKSIEASDLVSKLLKLSKLESRARSVQVSTIDVEKTIREVEKKFEAIMRRQNIELKYDVAAGNLQIQTDSNLFELVTENLLENAIKYSKPQNNIYVQISKGEDDVKVQIRDEGIGIPAQDLPRVFERFFRSHNAESHTHDGIGIGMAMVKSAMETLQGNIQVLSDQGRGTTMALTFPCQFNLESRATHG
ncbi:MAG: ATP-binding protein [Bdellovibrionota bacterium]